MRPFQNHLKLEDKDNNGSFTQYWCICGFTSDFKVLKQTVFTQWRRYKYHQLVHNSASNSVMLPGSPGGEGL